MAPRGLVGSRDVPASSVARCARIMRAYDSPRFLQDPTRASRIRIATSLAEATRRRRARGSRRRTGQGAGPDALGRRVHRQHEVRRHSRRGHRAREEDDARWLRSRAGGFGISGRTGGAAVHRHARSGAKVRDSGRHQPESARAIRGVRQWRVDSRRRLRRHRVRATRRGADPSAGLRALRRGAPQRPGPDARLSRRRRSRQQDRRRHLPAPRP